MRPAGGNAGSQGLSAVFVGYIPHAAGSPAAYQSVGLYIQNRGLCWLKQNRKSATWFFGLGRWTRGNAEICLLAKRGKPKRHSASVHQFIISPIEQHSKKPDVTRDKIVELAGDLPRVELFARQKTSGWDVWGNEVECDLTLT